MVCQATCLENDLQAMKASYVHPAYLKQMCHKSLDTANSTIFPCRNVRECFSITEHS